MSTTFGIIKDGEEIEIGFRGNYCRWQNKLAEFLPDDLKIEALDNSPQGVYTVGDFRKLVKEES